jgi:sugar phosphate isomerase/epimerase
MNRRDLLKSAAAMAALQPLLPAAPAGKHTRLRSSICAYSFRTALGNKTMTYQDLVRLAVELDADGLDLTNYWFPSSSDDFLLPLKRLAYKEAIEIHSIGMRTDMCQPTPELRQAQVLEVRKWVDIAERLGAGHLRVFGGKVPKNATEDEAAGWVVEALKAASEYASSKGIILGLENHGGITEKAERVIRILKQVDSPWVGINLDTGNFRTDPFRQIQMCVPYAVHFHMKSEMTNEQGEKVPSDWNRILGMAASGGYRGYCALEYEAKEDPNSAVPRLIRELNRICRKYST